MIRGSAPRRSHRRAAIAPGVTVAVAIVAIVGWMVRITPDQLENTLPQNLGDPALLTWLLAWQSHALVNSPGSWFDGNIFITHGMALGYSETMLPAVPVFALVYFVTGDAIVAHNVLILTLLLFSMWMTFLLARHLHLDRITALLSATAFTFSGFTFAHAGHTQLLTMGFFPLATLMLLRLLERRRVRDGVWFGVASAALITACLYYAVVWAAISAVVVVGDLARKRFRAGAAWWRSAATAAVTTGVCSAPVLLAYARFQSQVSFTRTIPEGSWLSLSDLAAPPTGSARYAALALRDSVRPAALEHTFFPGLVVTALASLVLVVLAMRVWHRLRDGDRAAPIAALSNWWLLALAGATALLVASAPGLPVVGGALTTAYQELPGFSSIRLPARLALPALLVLALVAGRGVREITDRVSLPRHVVPVAALALVIFELSTTIGRVDARPPEADRALYATLADLPAGRVVELPAASDADGAPGVYTEAARMLYSIGDWRGRFNGTSGGNPPGFTEEVALVNTFPSAASVEFLTANQIRYVVIHTVAQPGHLTMTPEAAEAAVAAYPSAIIARFDGIIVIDLGAATTSG